MPTSRAATLSIKLNTSIASSEQSTKCKQTVERKIKTTKKKKLHNKSKHKSKKDHQLPIEAGKKSTHRMENSPSATLRTRIAQQRERLDRFKSLGPSGNRGLERDISSDGSDGSYEEVPSLTASELYNRELDTKSRIQSNWEALIERISKYGEDEQGDVLDIDTLEVVVDKGHLKSLSEKHDGHIWHEDFDDSREDRNRKSRVKYNALKSVREAPERDDLMLVENRPTSSERLRSRVLQRQHTEFRGRPATPELSGYPFKVPQTPRTQSLSSGIDSLSIVSPSGATSPGSDEKATSTTMSSRAAVLRRLLIQRAKSRSSIDAASVSAPQQKNIQVVPSQSSPEITDLSEEDHEMNSSLTYNSSYAKNSFHKSVLRDNKIANARSPDPDSDAILRDIVSKVDGMRIAEGNHVTFATLIKKLKNNDKRLSRLIEKYESDEDASESPDKSGTPVQQNHSPELTDDLPIAFSASIISLSSDESEDENEETDNVEFVRPPNSASTQQNVLQKYYEAMETQEYDEIQNNDESFFSIDEDEPPDDNTRAIGSKHDESEDKFNIEIGSEAEEQENYLDVAEAVHEEENNIEVGSEVDEQEKDMDVAEAVYEERINIEVGSEAEGQENDMGSAEALSQEKSHVKIGSEDDEQESAIGISEDDETSRIGTAENPISLDEDSDSASDYEDATASLPREEVPMVEIDSNFLKAITPEPVLEDNNETQNLAKNEPTANVTEKTHLPSIDKPEFLRPSITPLRSQSAQADSSDEPLDNILRQLSRVDSPIKKRFATPNRKSGSGSIISTPSSSSHKKPSPLRFNLSPLNSRKRQSSSIIPDTPLRKKPSPIKIERQNSVFLMDELSTFEDSD